MPARTAFLLTFGLTLLITACSTHLTTLSGDGSSGQTIYRISEDTAFTTVLDLYAVLFPKQSVDDIVDGDRRGYNVDERTISGDWWHHRLLVVPAIGNDASGNEVRGYWYDYSGSGTFNPTSQKVTRVLQSIRARLDAAGTAASVTNLRDGKYETDGRAYLGLKRDARDIRPDARPLGEK
jgi:hypothetical protein